MTDKIVIQQVLGALIKRPQLLSEIDKYSLSIKDFSSKFEKYIFTAIKGLYDAGATEIGAIDIDTYLEADVTAKTIFENNNGIEYIHDIEDFVSPENFPYYYNRLKKLNLLRDLKRQGIDTKEFYLEDLTDPRADDINQAFEKLTVKDICTAVKKRILTLESNYSATGEIQVGSVVDGLEEMLEGLKENLAIGPAIQGDIYNQVIDGAVPGTLTIRSGGSGTGKALPNSTKIPTPNGWKTVGEIKPGDYLFDAFGKPTKVLNIYPQGKKEVWEVTFKDGRKAKCCNEHLWSYWTRTQKPSAITKRRFVTKTLNEIINSKKDKYDVCVPQQYAVDYKENNHFIPPYIFGLMLGDGSFRQHESNKSFQYSSENEILPRMIADTMGWALKKGSVKNYSWYFGTKSLQKKPNEKINIWVEDVLVEHMELLNTDSGRKFIPRNYIEDSIENRIDLLSGLLDSDGKVDKKGRIAYYTISKKMCDNVVEIVQSLGLKATVHIDSHKDTNICYIVDIIGRPADKVKLFKLPRKKELIENWYNSPNRKETNEYNAVVDIENLGYEEEMTCFYVDNAEHLFLMNDFIVTHNTRSAVGDACLLAYPIRYNSATWKWEQVGSNEKVLFVITEQSREQIQKMVLAYLTDMNESKFKYNNFTAEERVVLQQAIQLMKDYEDYFIIVKMPDPSIDLIKTILRENCLTKDITVVFYDYIFISTNLLREFSGFGLRNDELLLLMTTALKDLAVELNVPIFTATQVNANADDNRNIRNEASLAGGRATINKADNGAIMARPTKEELEVLGPVINTYGKPNLVTDIFKVRSGEWTQVRIWSIVDLGRMKKVDLFITDAQLNPVENFYEREEYKIKNWDSEKDAELAQKLLELNGPEASKETIESLSKLVGK